MASEPRVDSFVHLAEASIYANTSHRAPYGYVGEFVLARGHFVL